MEEKVICKICGFESEKTIQGHINSKHKLNNKGYNNLYPGAIIYTKTYMDFHHQRVMSRDSSYKKKLSENFKRMQSDPILWDKFSGRAQEVLSKPEIREKRKKAIISYYSNRSDEQIANQKKSVIDSWKDPIKRSNRVIAIKKASNTDESRKNRSDGRKKYYSGLNEEQRTKINNRLKEVWAQPEKRKKLEEIIKIGLKAAMSSEGKENLRKANLRPDVKKRRSESSRKNIIKVLIAGNKVSSLNRFLEKKMSDIGLCPKGEYPIGPYVVDFCFPENKLVIEADGDWWHANPEFQKEKHRTEFHPIQKKMMAVDKAKNSYLKNHDWKLLRFWERDIYKKTTECLNTVVGALS